jgi:toxin ParE1/3/4
MFVNWTSPAVRDLEAIADYIREDNPSAAFRVVQQLYESIESLAIFPNRGRAGRVTDTRELVLSPLPYIAVYKVIPGEVRIVSVRHTSREWPTTSFSKPKALS